MPNREAIADASNSLELDGIEDHLHVLVLAPPTIASFENRYI